MVSDKEVPPEKEHCTFCTWSIEELPLVGTVWRALQLLHERSLVSEYLLVLPGYAAVQAFAEEACGKPVIEARRVLS